MKTQVNHKDNINNEILSRILRYDSLIPCKTAFIDARTPGSDKKENFCIIGSGVAENPGQVVHLNMPHGFDIGAAKQPNGCKNSHHSHDTSETFVVHKGKWKFTLGEHGEDAEVILDEGDTITLPTKVFRGFENVGDDEGFLYCVLGVEDNGVVGNVTWAPYVIKNATNHGLVLLEDGRLIDTHTGQSVPEDSKQVSPISQQEVKQYRKVSNKEEVKKLILANNQVKSSVLGSLSQYDGVKEYLILSDGDNGALKADGQNNWKHDFSIYRLILEPQAIIPEHIRLEEEVLFIHKGKLQVCVDGEEFDLNQGDLFTTPINAKRSFKNQTDEEIDIIVVRKGAFPHNFKKA